MDSRISCQLTGRLAMVVLRAGDSSGGNFLSNSMFHHTAAATLSETFLQQPAVGDLDGNHTPDVVTVGGNNTVEVLLNGNPGISEGAYSTGTALTIPALSAQAFEPVSVTIGDLNGDDLPDLVVGGANSSYPDWRSSGARATACSTRHRR
jgi:hypothetical protein